MRTLTCDISRSEGKSAELWGWIVTRRDHGKLIFIDLRDRTGTAQVVFTPTNQELHKLADTLRPEWVVRVSGTVQSRPAGMENPNVAGGSHELAAESLEILAKAETPPLDLSGDGREIGEDVRMKYRYIDLRRPRLQKNIRKRAEVNRFLRNELAERGFVEIETPYIGKSTPEGARDYLVPSRLHPGTFYALAQSPQQYKQLLMVAGFENYFQIVRCFRDEDTRGDRQPEFTQLDIEMSFVTQEDILRLLEEVYLKLARTLYPEKKLSLTEDEKIPRMTHEEAMQKYQTDKPDVRKDIQDPNELAFLWVVNFPAFEWKKEERRYDAVHHPFTQPQVKDLTDFNEQFAKDPAEMLAYQYDLVLNGYEVAGGSIRIHDPALLRRVFEALGNEPAVVEAEFGHMFEAFKYGVPPHGGIASGLDRFVAVLQNEPNIREVIAFPKTGDGRDLMTGAPGKVGGKQLKELHIQTENIK